MRKMGNKSHLPLLTSYDNPWLPRCCNAVHIRCPWISAQSYQMEKNMSNERCSSKPRQNPRRVSQILSDLKSLLMHHKHPAHSALTSREQMRWWLVSSAGSGAYGFRKLGSSVPGGDLPAFTGRCWGSWHLSRGQSAPGWGCSSIFLVAPSLQRPVKLLSAIKPGLWTTEYWY